MFPLTEPRVHVHALRPSSAARRKASTRRNEPVGRATLQQPSFRTLIANFARLARNAVWFAIQRVSVVIATPSPLQLHALALLGAEPPAPQETSSSGVTYQ